MKEGFAVTNGIRMFYVSEGEGPLVLLCHGFPELWYSWRHQIEPIAAAGFSCVAVDLPGYGRSDKPDVVYDIEFLTACLAGLIESLGYEEAIVAGHDWGGLIVWPFARMYPQHTAGVIALNTPDLPRPPIPTVEFLQQIGSVEHNYIVQFQERYAAEQVIEADVDVFMTGVFHSYGTVNDEAFPPEVIEVFASAFRPKGAITPALEYYRNMNRNWELLEPYDDIKIEVPCLMISADSDPFLPEPLTQGMEYRVPDLTRALIEDCGHWTQQERPEETTRAMVDWLTDRFAATRKGDV